MSWHQDFQRRPYSGSRQPGLRPHNASHHNMSNKFRGPGTGSFGSPMSSTGGRFNRPGGGFIGNVPSSPNSGVTSSFSSGPRPGRGRGGMYSGTNPGMERSMSVNMNIPHRDLPYRKNNWQDKYDSSDPAKQAPSSYSQFPAASGGLMPTPGPPSQSSMKTIDYGHGSTSNSSLHSGSNSFEDSSPSLRSGMKTDPVFQEPGMNSPDADDVCISWPAYGDEDKNIEQEDSYSKKSTLPNQKGDNRGNRNDYAVSEDFSGLHRKTTDTVDFSAPRGVSGSSSNRIMEDVSTRSFPSRTSDLGKGSTYGGDRGFNYGGETKGGRQSEGVHDSSLPLSWGESGSDYDAKSARDGIHSGGKVSSAAWVEQNIAVSRSGANAPNWTPPGSRLFPAAANMVRSDSGRERPYSTDRHTFRGSSMSDSRVGDVSIPGICEDVGQPSDIYCSVCDLYLNSEKNYQVHCSSSMHQDRIRIVSYKVGQLPSGPDQVPAKERASGSIAPTSTVRNQPSGSQGYHNPEALRRETFGAAQEYVRPTLDHKGQSYSRPIFDSGSHAMQDRINTTSRPEVMKVEPLGLDEERVGGKGMSVPPSPMGQSLSGDALGQITSQINLGEMSSSAVPHQLPMNEWGNMNNQAAQVKWLAEKLGLRQGLTNLKNELTRRQEEPPTPEPAAMPPQLEAKVEPPKRTRTGSNSIPRKVKPPKPDDGLPDNVFFCKMCEQRCEGGNTWNAHISSVSHNRMYLKKIFELGEVNFNKTYGNVPFTAHSGQEFLEPVRVPQLGHNGNVFRKLIFRSSMANLHYCRLCNWKNYNWKAFEGHIRAPPHLERCLYTVQNMGIEQFIKEYGDLPIPTERDSIISIGFKGAVSKLLEDSSPNTSQASMNADVSPVSQATIPNVNPLHSSPISDSTMMLGAVKPMDKPIVTVQPTVSSSEVKGSAKSESRKGIQENQDKKVSSSNGKRIPVLGDRDYREKSKAGLGTTSKDVDLRRRDDVYKAFEDKLQPKDNFPSGSTRKVEVVRSGSTHSRDKDDRSGSQSYRDKDDRRKYSRDRDERRRRSRSHSSSRRSDKDDRRDGSSKYRKRESRSPFSPDDRKKRREISKDRDDRSKGHQDLKDPKKKEEAEKAAIIKRFKLKLRAEKKMASHLSNDQVLADLSQMDRTVVLQIKEKTGIASNASIVAALRLLSCMTSSELSAFGGMGPDAIFSLCEGV